MDNIAMAARGRRRVRSGALILILLMLSASFLSLIPAPLASAAGGDLSIWQAESPLEGANYSKNDLVKMQVGIWNKGTVQMNEARTVRWYACVGEHTASGCPNDDRSGGVGSISNLGPDETTILIFTTSFFPNADRTGVHTAEFKFEDLDNNPSNDVLRFNFWIADTLFDIAIDEQHDPRPADSDYAIYESEYVYNSNTSYPLYVEGTSNNCLGCIFEVEMGWRLKNDLGVIIAENSTNISDFSEWGEQGFNRSLPDLVSPLEGVFTLEVGVFNSSAEDQDGDASEDLNSFNNLVEMSVIFNDNIDLSIQSMYPAYKFDSPDYFFGNDSVAVVVVNNGNKTVGNNSLYLKIFHNDGTLEDGPWQCDVPSLMPRNTHKCLFDLNVFGRYQLNASLSSTFDDIADINPNDNWIHETITIVGGDLTPSITLDRADGVYNTGDSIELVAQVGSTAAQPLNYTWWVGAIGVISLGQGRVLYLPPYNLTMGDHTVLLYVVDAVGNGSSASKTVTIYNRTSLIAEPVITGYALTRTHATLSYNQELPRLNTRYNLPTNVSALMLFEIDVVSTEPEKPDPGVESMDLEFNLSSLVPSSVAYESLQMYWLDSLHGGVWTAFEEPDSFQVNNATSASMHLITGGSLLLVGELPPIEVSAENISVERLQGGHLKVKFEPTGDIENVYFSGWRILKRVNDRNIAMRHPTDATVEQTEEYENLYFVTDIEANVSIWFDPQPLYAGFCASYAIIPFDRQGISDWSRGNISGWQGSGLPDMQCGDAIPPSSGVTDLKATDTFTNSSQCYNDHHDWNMCYVVNLTWNWPNTSELLKFHLYRLEMQPDDTLNLSQLLPIARNLSGETGGNAWWNESSDHGIRPDHTYYYVLAPIDEIGNVNLVPDTVPGCYVKVSVKERFWEFNQHLIPEPPPPTEPPYGVEYLGELKDWMDDSRFRVIGFATLVAFCINMIALPLLLKQRAKLKTKSAQKEKAGGDFEFDDDLAGFFT